MTWTITGVVQNGKQGFKHCSNLTQFWVPVGIARCRAFATGRALPVVALPASYLMTCGRGGTGRRAALRSLWPKGRGSSSLLDRTIT